MNGVRYLFVFGTRPEAIKMAPLVRHFLEHLGNEKVKVCVTGQHKEMLQQVLDFFGIVPDYNLALMRPNQTLFDITAEGLKGLERVIKETNPSCILVQGDTTTAFIGALAGFYTKTKVAHIEAGLRSGNKFSPFPEEVNRILAGHLSDFHFPPTIKAEENLRKEQIVDNIYTVGNTVIDALFLGLDLIQSNGESEYRNRFSFLDLSKRIILVTGHRRESFGGPFEDICQALLDIRSLAGDIEIVYPVHLNPNVLEPVNRILGSTSGIHLIEPLSYPNLIWLMSKSHLVLTDSGGIQEEAPSLGKPVLVMREVTERQEGIDAGTALLVGTNRENIVNNTKRLLEDQAFYNHMAKAVNPYGDGKASERILKILENAFN